MTTARACWTRRDARASIARVAGRRRSAASVDAGSAGAGLNLIVIGGRGCGKSSVCRRLAAADKRFKHMSLDDLIVYEAGGASIPAIVDERGWRGFRELEFEVCVKAGRAFDGFALIDAGGGVVTDLDENGEEVFSQRKVDALKAKGGVIVFLDRDVDYLIERIAGDSNRPDLNASKSFREIMERRLPWYKKAADFIVDGGGNDANERPLVKKKRLASTIAAYYYAQSGVEPLADQWFQLDVGKRN